MNEYESKPKYTNMMGEPEGFLCLCIFCISSFFLYYFMTLSSIFIYHDLIYKSCFISIFETK